MKDPKIDRATAWGCLVTNLLVLPGLGTLAAKGRGAILQMVLSIGGFIMTSIALVRFLAAWIQNGIPEEFGTFLWPALGGIGIFLVGWIWALGSSLLFLRDSSTKPSASDSVQPPRIP